MDNILFFVGAMVGVIGFYLYGLKNRGFTFNKSSVEVRIDYSAYRKQKLEMALDFIERLKRGQEFKRQWVDTRLGQCSAKHPTVGIWKTGRELVEMPYDLIKVEVFKSPMRFNRKYESPKIDY